MQQVKLTLPHLVLISFMYDALSHSFSVELTLLSSRRAYAVRSKMESAGATAHALQIILQMGFLAEAV